MSTTRFYKIEIGNNTYQKITVLIQQINDAHHAAHQLAMELGSTDGFYLFNRRLLAGDVFAIRMDVQPEGWKKVLPKWFPGCYYPKKIKANREVLSEIQALPAIPRIELNQLLGYNSEKGAPGLREGDNMYLVAMPHGFNDVKPAPTPDMIQITGFEYVQLSKSEDIAFEIQY